MPQQLTFTWAPDTSLVAEDFIRSGANEEAANLLDRWPEPASPAALLLSGPEACGKTHLASIWGRRHRAVFIAGANLGRMTSAEFFNGSGHAVLENIEQLEDETALFHLLRHAETEGAFLLLTARAPVRDLPFTLPDLRSRLLALPPAVIDVPDEALLKAFLFKYFADRQMRVEEDVFDYIARRVERSFAAVRRLAEAAEKRSYESKKPVTIPLIRSLMG